MLRMTLFRQLQPMTLHEGTSRNAKGYSKSTVMYTRYDIRRVIYQILTDHNTFEYFSYRQTINNDKDWDKGNSKHDQEAPETDDTQYICKLIYQNKGTFKTVEYLAKQNHTVWGASRTHQNFEAATGYKNRRSRKLQTSRKTIYLRLQLMTAHGSPSRNVKDYSKTTVMYAKPNIHLVIYQILTDQYTFEYFLSRKTKNKDDNEEKDNNREPGKPDKISRLPTKEHKTSPKYMKIPTPNKQNKLRLATNAKNRCFRARKKYKHKSLPRQANLKSYSLASLISYNYVTRSIFNSQLKRPNAGEANKAKRPRAAENTQTGQPSKKT